MTSNYEFPIFISSTVHDLVDLREELANDLRNNGYCPKLSTEEGFPHCSPELQPYESCLTVLEQCYVAIIIINNRYGEKFSWPNFTTTFQNKKLSPTHAEYLYAINKGLRTLVFIRDDILNDYKRYRQAKKKLKTANKVKNHLHLPPYIDFNIFTFIEEIKTNHPTPYITAFNSVLQVFSEI
jgi:hypothetical protein